MTREEVFNKTVEIAKEAFEKEELIMTDSTTSEDVESWDSLTHLNLISDIEDEFGITFTLDEVTSLKNFGELVNVLMKHIDKK